MSASPTHTTPLHYHHTTTVSLDYSLTLTTTLVYFDDLSVLGEYGNGGESIGAWWYWSTRSVIHAYLLRPHTSCTLVWWWWDTCHIDDIHEYLLLVYEWVSSVRSECGDARHLSYRYTIQVTSSRYSTNTIVVDLEHIYHSSLIHVLTIGIRSIKFDVGRYCSWGDHEYAIFRPVAHLLHGEPAFTLIPSEWLNRFKPYSVHRYTYSWRSSWKNNTLTPSHLVEVQSKIISIS